MLCNSGHRLELLLTAKLKQSQTWIITDCNVKAVINLNNY